MNTLCTVLLVWGCTAALCHGLYCHMSWVTKTNNMARKGFARQAFFSPLCLIFLIYLCFEYRTFGIRFKPWTPK